MTKNNKTDQRCPRHHVPSACLPACQVNLLLSHANWAAEIKVLGMMETTNIKAFEITCVGGKHVILRIVDESEGPSFSYRLSHYRWHLIRFPGVLRDLVLGMTDLFIRSCGLIGWMTKKRV